MRQEHITLLLFVVCSDNADDSELPRQDSDSEGVDEVENEDEVMWRRMRHEREIFLQQQKVTGQSRVVAHIFFSADLGFCCPTCCHQNSLFLLSAFVSKLIVFYHPSVLTV
jgi:hypothetical protein